MTLRVIHNLLCQLCGTVAKR